MVILLTAKESVSKVPLKVLLRHDQITESNVGYRHTNYYNSWIASIEVVMNPFPSAVQPRLLIKCATWFINVWFVQILRSVSESETWFMLNTGKNQNSITLRSSGCNSRPNSTAYCILRSKINPNETNFFKWFSNVHTSGPFVRDS